MKRIISWAFATALILSFAAVGFAQQSTQKSEKKPTTAPASTEHKATMEQKATTMATETLQLSKNEIMALQNALIKEKAYKGKANGMLDSVTKSAIRKYQTDHKLKVTGEPRRLCTNSASPTRPRLQSRPHSRWSRLPG